MELLRDAMAGWFMVRLERGATIPEPRSAPATEYSGRVLLRMPPSLHRQVADLAEQDHTSLNATLVSLLSQALGQRQAARADESVMAPQEVIGHSNMYVAGLAGNLHGAGAIGGTTVEAALRALAELQAFLAEGGLGGRVRETPAGYHGRSSG
jgi:hypothetical protein